MAKKLPEELRTTATLEDVNSLSEDIGRCYSKDRFEEFQEAVEKIATKHFKGMIGWFGLLWILSIVVTVLLQKFKGII